jgi:transposase InsO family protein
MIVEIHDRSRRTYGAPRVHAELARLGRRCGRKRVARLMRSQQLVGVHARRRWRRGRPDTAAAPDLVQRNFNPTGPDRLWAADVTQFHTGEGWLHLAAVIDLWSRRVVGWAMGTTVNAELVSDALVMAFQRRRPDRRVVHHSDRGAALHLPGVLPARRRARGRPVLRLHRRLLRQRRSRVVLRHPQTRARLDPRHQAVADSNSPPLSAVRLHRRLLQPRTHPHRLGHQSPINYEQDSAAQQPVSTQAGQPHARSPAQKPGARDRQFWRGGASGRSLLA